MALVTAVMTVPLVIFSKDARPTAESKSLCSSKFLARTESQLGPLGMRGGLSQAGKVNLSLWRKLRSVISVESLKLEFLCRTLPGFCVGYGLVFVSASCLAKAR